MTYLPHAVERLADELAALGDVDRLFDLRPTVASEDQLSAPFISELVHVWSGVEDRPRDLHWQQTMLRPGERRPGALGVEFLGNLVEQATRVLSSGVTPGLTDRLDAAIGLLACGPAEGAAATSGQKAAQMRLAGVAVRLALDPWDTEAALAAARLAPLIDRQPQEVLATLSSTRRRAAESAGSERRMTGAALGAHAAKAFVRCVGTELLDASAPAPAASVDLRRRSGLIDRLVRRGPSGR